MSPRQKLADTLDLRHRPLDYLGATSMGSAARRRPTPRLARREAPAVSATDADITGLRFSARHPLILRRAEGPSLRIDEGVQQSPDASRIAATLTHGSLT